MSKHTREATHAGSCASSGIHIQILTAVLGDQLRAELQRNLDKVTSLPDLDYAPPVQDAKAIIAPHAGYSYSGPAAAWAYAAIPTDRIKRVVLLGPSHHAYLPGVALSKFKSYGTPVGDIPLDMDAIAELRATGTFSDMSSSVDEDEHSLEMHLPYIRHIFAGRDDLKLVPILVGHPSKRTMDEINKALEKYWHDPATFFVVSSDFCHWGSRFSCMPYYPEAPHPPNPVPPLPHQELPASWEPPKLVRRFDKKGKAEIWESIQYMDHEGIELLRRPGEFGAREKWEGYLDETKNTICGRAPISVLVALIQHLFGGKDGPKPEFTFVRYEQSSKCFTAKDSSVSYVSGVLRLPRAAGGRTKGTISSQSDHIRM